MPYLYPFLPFTRYGPTVADMTRYEVSTHNIGMTTLGEYVPKWVTKVPVESPFVDDLVAGRPIDRLDPASLPDGAAARLEESRPNGFSYRIDSPQPFSARFRVFYFPGWQAVVDGQPVPAGPEPQTGFVTVSLPAGSYAVELVFADTPLRRTANAISIVTLVAIAAISAGRVVTFTRRRGTMAPYPTPAWPLRPAVSVAVCLVVILVFKSLYVDTHTGWFRRNSPPGQVLGVQHPLSVNLGNSFQLLGYDISRDAVAQGQRLEVVLYWQKTGAGEETDSTNYRTFVHLDSPLDRRTWAASDHAHPGDPVAQIDLPTSTWDTGRYVRDRHIFLIPPDVPPVTFNLTAGVYNPDTGKRLPIEGTSEDTIFMQSMPVQPGVGLNEKDIPVPLEYVLGDDISLLGYGWETNNKTLSLFWRCRTIPTSPAVVFVHLLDNDGNLVWGADSPRVGRFIPPPPVGRPAASSPTPESLPWMTCRPEPTLSPAGMYDSTTGQRLTVVDAAGQEVTDGSIPLFPGGGGLGRYDRT